jgi:hypothetical protein
MAQTRPRIENCEWPTTHGPLPAVRPRRTPVTGITWSLLSLFCFACGAPAGGDVNGSSSDPSIASTTIMLGTSSSTDGDTTGPVDASTSAGDCPMDLQLVGDVLVDDASSDDLACVVRIEGALAIGPSATLNVLPLGRLVEVTGDVTISGNAALESLAGLEALATVGGIVKVSENPSLTSVAALGELEALAGLELFDDQALVDIAALAAHPSFTAGESGVATLTIIGLPALVDLGGLAHVEDVDVSGRLQVTLELDENIASVAGLAGFFTDGQLVDVGLGELPALADVDLGGTTQIGTLVINHAAGLGTIGGLAGLTSAAAIEITDAPMLASLEGLDDLTSVAGTLSIGGCGGGESTGITTMAGLGALADAGVLELNGQTQMTSLDGLSTDVELGDLRIMQNPLLPTADAMAYADAVMPSDDTLVCGNQDGTGCETGGCEVPD